MPTHQFSHSHDSEEEPSNHNEVDLAHEHEDYEHYTEKCGHCNWPTSQHFVKAPTPGDALRGHSQEGWGQCGDCYAEWLMELEEASDG